MDRERLRGFAGAVLFCVLALLLLGVWRAARPGADGGEKTVTVEVVHADGTKREFSYRTEREYLEELLTEEGLISGTAGEYGLFVDTVDGETADFARDGSWWRLTCNGQDAQTGAAGAALRDGDVYGWIYTAG